MSIPTRNPFPPPLTLTQNERFVVEQMSDEARRFFEAESVRLEFDKGEVIDRAEAEALTATVTRFGIKRA
jgi:hypothetical protein